MLLWICLNITEHKKAITMTLAEFCFGKLLDMTVVGSRECKSTVISFGAWWNLKKSDKNMILLSLFGKQCRTEF